jgi:hypothetical protein
MGQKELLTNKNLPNFSIINKFIMNKGANINWILEKSFFFQNLFYKNKLKYFEKKQLNINKYVSRLSGVRSSFPDKPKFLRKSYLLLSIEKLQSFDYSIEFDQVWNLKQQLYEPIKKRKKKKKQKKKKTVDISPLSYMNLGIKDSPNLRSSKKKNLNLFRKFLNLHIVNDISLSHLSKSNEKFDHLSNQCKPDLELDSESCLKFKNIWKKKNKKKAISIKRVLGYYGNFEKELSEIEQYEQQIKIYHQMFKKHIPFSFIQNNQMRFYTNEIDLFKQVETLLCASLLCFLII